MWTPVGKADPPWLFNAYWVTFQDGRVMARMWGGHWEQSDIIAWAHILTKEPPTPYNPSVQQIYNKIQEAHDMCLAFKSKTPDDCHDMNGVSHTLIDALTDLEQKWSLDYVP